MRFGVLFLERAFFLVFGAATTVLASAATRALQTTPGEYYTNRHGRSDETKEQQCCDEGLHGCDAFVLIGCRRWFTGLCCVAIK
ncbi:MAG: hypothetical protein ACI8W3_002580 [Myxococcota bacterium]|jgi:hypothetical protein